MIAFNSRLLLLALASLAAAGPDRYRHDRASPGAASHPPEYRPIDGRTPGSDNGAADTFFVRLPGRATYADGKSVPTGTSRPDARVISNEIFAQTPGTPKSAKLTAMAIYFGQFLDHDTALIEADHSRHSCSEGEPMPIDVPRGDPVFDPHSRGGVQLPFSRADHCEGCDGVRQHPNAITHFVDGSNIYGSGADLAMHLRSMFGGKLRVLYGEPGDVDLERPMLYDARIGDLTRFMDMCTRGRPCFLVGDTRGNENIALSALHLVFVREHNKVADELDAAHHHHAGWDNDERLYQEARKIVIAKYQAIVYYEWLPAMLGSECPAVTGGYPGYNPHADASIPIEFDAATFRFGHSAIPDTVELRNADLSRDAVLELKDVFFSPGKLTRHNFEKIMLGISKQPAEETDAKVVDALRNLLFADVGTDPHHESVGEDLLARNIQRGRDLAIASYNDLREALGLARAKTFSDITSDSALAHKLHHLYGSVDDVDAIVGAFAEDKHKTSTMGELFTTSICETFHRLRVADPYDFERPGQFDPSDRATLAATRFRHILQRNLVGVPDANIPTRPFEQGAHLHDEF